MSTQRTKSSSLSTDNQTEIDAEKVLGCPTGVPQAPEWDLGWALNPVPWRQFLAHQPETKCAPELTLAYGNETLSAQSRWPTCWTKQVPVATPLLCGSRAGSGSGVSTKQKAPIEQIFCPVEMQETKPRVSCCCIPLCQAPPAGQVGAS